jgi:hypothetical protein
MAFSIKAPSGSTVTLEIQARITCSASSYASKLTTINGLTGAIQTIAVPLQSFYGVKANAIVGFVLSTSFQNGHLVANL